MTLDAGTDVTRCAVCDGVLRTPARRGRPRLTCSNRCRKAYNRAIRGQAGSNSTQGSKIVTSSAEQYREPPPAPERRFLTGADLRFRQQLADVETRAKPWTEEELRAIDQMRRNPGVAHPLAQQRWIEAERRRREAEMASYDQALQVEDTLVPGSVGHLARRANASRQANRRRDDPRMSLLRPGPPRGRHPLDDTDPECFDWPSGRNTVPWRGW